MRILITMLGGGAVLALAATRSPSPTPVPPDTKAVTVHCSEGSRGAFVTPTTIRLTVGDSLEWQTGGTVVADSIQITLKDPEQAWPFDGTPARGGSTARANRALTPGTYSYNVRLLCRVPGGGIREENIDPDIIIGV